MLYAKSTEMGIPPEKFKIKISTRNQDEGFIFRIPLNISFSYLNTLPLQLTLLEIEIKKTFCGFWLKFLF
jgi:hypothetical protein